MKDWVFTIYENTVALIVWDRHDRVGFLESEYRLRGLSDKVIDSRVRLFDLFRGFSG